MANWHDRTCSATQNRSPRAIWLGVKQREPRRCPYCLMPNRSAIAANDSLTSDAGEGSAVG